MEGCGWFQLSDRARRGDMVDTVSAGWFVMVECNSKNEKWTRRKRWREEGEGGARGGVSKFHLNSF